ncbi:MAG: hypothetical protein H6619_06855 [Deltaproteobacteria bacterium]|nr:hypothetical protein [Deltaproteobacteria bacterium]
MRNIFLLTISILFAFKCSYALPPELEPLRDERDDQIREGLNKEGIVHYRSLGQGTHPVINPRYRDTEPGSGYLSHDETDLTSTTVMPYESFTRLNKAAIAAGYLDNGTTWNTFTDRFGLAVGSSLQLLMLQDPTLAATGMNLHRLQADKIASFQRDRQIELTHRNGLPNRNPEAEADLDRCVALNTMGISGDSITGGFSYGTGATPGDYQSAVAYCRAQINTLKYLASRDAIGVDGCDWSSLAMFGYSGEVALRMRAQFGDISLCPVAHETNSYGTYSTYERVIVPPSFSTREVWWDEYQDTLAKVDSVIKKQPTDGGAYNLSTDDILAISIGPNAKADQELIAAIEDGYDPTKFRPEVVNWWAMEKASALVDLTCSEAEIALREAGASIASAMEKQNWRERVDAVCGARQEVIEQMKITEKQRMVFDNIVKTGEKARFRFSESHLAAAKALSDRTQKFKSINVFGSGLPNEFGEDAS